MSSLTRPRRLAAVGKHAGSHPAGWSCQQLGPESHRATHFDVGFPPVLSVPGCKGCIHARRFRQLLPGSPVQGRPVRRLVRDRRAQHRDLLPAQLSGAATVAAELAVLPDGRRGSGGRLPGLQTLPPRRLPRIAGMECARRYRGPRDATDRRRHRGPVRSHRPRRPARLHHPAAGATPTGRGRRQPAGSGPCTTHQDRPGSHRDH